MIAEMEGLAEGEKIARKWCRHAGRIKSRAQSVRARLCAGALHMQISPGGGRSRAGLITQGAPAAGPQEGTQCRLVAAAFAFFLAGTTQANTGQGFKALGGDGVAAFTAAGYAVDPFRAAAIYSGTGPQEG